MIVPDLSGYLYLGRPGRLWGVSRSPQGADKILSREDHEGKEWAGTSLGIIGTEEDHRRRQVTPCQTGRMVSKTNLAEGRLGDARQVIALPLRGKELGTGATWTDAESRTVRGRLRSHGLIRRRSLEE